MKKALVTGANGFLGSLLVEKLLKNNVEVIAADLSGHNDRISPKARFVDFDMHSCELITEKIKDKDIDIMFHLAWAGSSGDARGDYTLQLDNVKCTCDAVKLAAEMNIKKFVGAGSIKQLDCEKYLKQNGSAPGLIHNYGTAKTAAQYMSKSVANSKGIEHVWCLFPSVYGVGDSTDNFINTTLRKILLQELPEFTSGEQNSDFVYISDMIHGLYLCGKSGKPNFSYYIGSGEPRKLKDYIKIIADTTGSSVLSGLNKVKFNGISLPLQTYDCKKIFDDTGYKPKVLFNEGIKKTFDWLKKTYSGEKK